MLPRRINLITLGVADVGASRTFYEGLGFRASSFDSDEVAFFDMNGTILGLFGRKSLANDAAVAAFGDGPQAVTLAINFASKAEVDAALSFVESKGAAITQPAREVFWGGYSGYFADPDGHLWELAYNPITVLGPDGHMQLPPPRV